MYVVIINLNILLCYNNNGHRSMDELMQQSSTKNDDVAILTKIYRVYIKKKIDRYSSS